MGFIGTILKVLGIGFLLIVVLPAVVTFLLPILSVVLMVAGVIGCFVFVYKFVILGR